MNARLLFPLLAMLLVPCLPTSAAAWPDDKVDKDDKAEGPAWVVDFEKAKELAAKENLDILMEFTGSDWCPPCIKLYNNVLTKEVFRDLAPKHFVLLKLDNPRDKSKQSEEEIQQYKDLSKKYGIRGVPTVILADAQGKPYSIQVGYGGQAAEAYTKALVDKATVRKERDVYLAKAQKASGVERAKLLARAIGRIDGDVALKHYRESVDEIIKLDADNEAGLKEKYADLLRVTEINEKLTKIQTEFRGDPEAGVKRLEEFIAEEKITGEPLQSALFAKAGMLFRDDKQAARKALELALEAAPTTQRAQQIRTLLKSAFKDEE